MAVGGAVGQSASEVDCLLARGECFAVPTYVAQAPSQCRQSVGGLRRVERRSAAGQSPVERSGLLRRLQGLGSAPDGGPTGCQHLQGTGKIAGAGTDLLLIEMTVETRGFPGHLEGLIDIAHRAQSGSQTCQVRCESGRVYIRIGPDQTPSDGEGLLGGDDSCARPSGLTQAAGERDQGLRQPGLVGDRIIPAQAPVEVHGLLSAGQGVTQLAGSAQVDGEAAQSLRQPGGVGVVIVPGQATSDPDRLLRDRNPLTHVAGLAQAVRHDGQPLGKIWQVRA